MSKQGTKRVRKHGSASAIYDTPPMTEAQEQELMQALKRLSNDADGMPSLAIERRMARATLNLLQDGQQITKGNVAVFYQWRQKCDHHLSRSCAVRVDDIAEVTGLFKEFFEL